MEVLDKVPFKGWKTILFNAATIAAVYGNMLPEKYAVPVVGIGNILLRIITTTPVFKSTPSGPAGPLVPLLLAGLLLFHPVSLSAQSSSLTQPVNVVNAPTINITTATVDSSYFNSVGLGSILVQWKFGTVAGSFTTCTVQAKTSVNGSDYLTLGSAIPITVTTGTINIWNLGGSSTTTVSSSASPVFGSRTKFTFACSAYGTSAPVTISVVGTPINSSGNVPVVTLGGDTFSTNQVSVTTSATQIVAAATRIGVSVTNTGTTAVYCGPTSGVTTSNGDFIPGTAGASAFYTVNTSVYCIVGAGSQTVSYAEAK